ncbi:MAG: hypothetical protein IPG71_07950 [bacterium]|nr:hypothetical protein [bacterium]
MTFREKIGWKVLSWKIRQPHEGRVSLPGVTAGVKNACIVLPANFDDFDVVRTILPEVIERLPEARITIWVRDNFRSWLVINEQCTVMSYEPADATKLGMPDDRTRAQARANEFDLMLDLSLTPELYVAGLVKEVRAELKIALDHPSTRDMYNVLVETEAGDQGKRLVTLLKYL